MTQKANDDGSGATQDQLCDWNSYSNIITEVTSLNGHIQSVQGILRRYLQQEYKKTKLRRMDFVRKDSTRAPSNNWSMKSH